MSSRKPRTPDLLFVCTGNICRSAMAEQIARQWLCDRQTGRPRPEVSIGSAGISDEEHGNPLDPRAARVLIAAGYETGDHRAHRVTDAELDAPMIVGMEPHHLDALARRGARPEQLSLVTDLLPALVDGSPRPSGLPDPWYGDMSDFEYTFRILEAAMPGLAIQLTAPPPCSQN